MMENCSTLPLPTTTEELIKLILLQQKKLNNQEDLLKLQTGQINSLEEKLRLALLRRFGKSSEKYADTGEVTLFDEVENIENSESENSDETSIDVPGHTRKKRRGKRGPLPDFLPRLCRNYELSEQDQICPIGGKKLKRIGESISEQLDIIPAKVQVLQHVRGKYVCSCCESTYTREATMPAQPIPKSQASPGLLAHVAVSKYADHLPLFRQASIFARSGVDIDRTTMARWIIQLADLARPLFNLMLDEIKDRRRAHIDETSLQVLADKGKRYMWVVACPKEEGLPALVLFHYNRSRATTVVEDLLGDFEGALIADGYSAYKSFAKAHPEIVLCACMAHVRRKFWEAEKAAKSVGKSDCRKLAASMFLQIIRELYVIEKRISGMKPDEILEVRQAESAPLMTKLRKTLEDHAPLHPPKSSLLGVAVNYALNEWDGLERFLKDGRIAIDNNFVEAMIRPFAIGRKNWMFSASTNGAEASSVLYSLIQTARANSIDPYEYLRMLFTELPKAELLEDYQALLPSSILAKPPPD